jgi:hypothetical protein
MSAESEIVELDAAHDAVVAKQEGGGKGVIISLSQKDADVAEKIMNLQKSLLSVKAEIQKSPIEKYPFTNHEHCDDAKHLALDLLQVQIRTAFFVMKLLQCKTLKKTPLSSYDDSKKEAFMTAIATFQSWFQNVNQLHQHHMQAVMGLFHEFLDNDSPARMQEIENILKGRLRCPKHPDQPPVAIDFDGKTPVCRACIIAKA